MQVIRLPRRIWVSALAVLSVLTIGATLTYANWPGSITNGTNTLQSATISSAFKYTGYFGTVTCNIAAGASTPTARCPIGSIYDSAALLTTGLPKTYSGPSITPGGTATAAQRSTTGTFSVASSCPAQALSNSLDTADPLLARADFGQIIFNTTDPWATTNAVSTQGFSYGSGAALQTSPNAVAGGYSIGLWFKSTNKGGYMSFDPTSYNATTSSTSSPAIWTDSSGHLGFSLATTTGTVTAKSAAVMSTTAWHFVVLSVPITLGLTATPTMYIDGSATTVTLPIPGTALLPSGTSGYWHLNWANAPGQATVSAGGLTSGAWYRAAPTSATEVDAMRTAANFGAYQTYVTGRTAMQSFWPLNDDGTYTYSGSIPGVPNPCGTVQVDAWGTTNAGNTCDFLAGITPTPVTFDKVLGKSFTCAVTAPTVAQTLSITLRRSASWVAPAQQLRLYVPVTYTTTSAPGTGWSQTFTLNSAGHVLIP
ncbi:hypothetical protein Back2_13360 [Nocardioides baekrokdamisoli]|uniref:Uncharacterized protein n=1 Tax=Nocardioides baekrokdamisoli TaxID=1804624 RepID=A0A3G9J234_9ACTN|nr:hypothetical protein [Nocardioides baekrokdamisoli]BBH17049.1 hypothetical protein Back2_13360 [Nocardioides baekrokdamisoli]